MEKDQLISLHANFEEITQTEESGCEFWYARELQELLGYTQWRNFEPVIEKAIISCENARIDPLDHFARVRKMVDIGSGARREIEDIALSRYACYLVAQNGDPTKEAIAFAQTYFAVQTRKMEVIEQRLEELERLGFYRRVARGRDPALFFPDATGILGPTPHADRNDANLTYLEATLPGAINLLEDYRHA